MCIIKFLSTGKKKEFLSVHGIKKNFWAQILISK